MSAQSLSSLDSLFASPELAEVIDRVSEGLPPRERADFCQTVRLRVLAAKEKPKHPKAWLRALSRAQLVDRHRRRRVRVDPHCDDGVDLDGLVGLDPTAPAGEWDPIDAKKLIACFLAEVKAGRISERQAAIVFYRALGMTHAEIGKFMGVAEKTVRNEASKVHKTARKARIAFLTAAAFVAAALLLWLLRRDPYVAHVGHPLAAPSAPTQVAPPLPPSSRPVPGHGSRH